MDVNRRKFFGLLAGIVAAPTILIKAAQASTPIAVVAKPRKLKCEWSVDDAASYKAMVDAISDEIDREVLEMILKNGLTL
jgi:hypothetical protein